MAKEKSAGLGSFPLEHAALGLLFAGAKHGYQLFRDFTIEFHLIWKAGQANFYVALANLEASNLVTATTEMQEGRPPRKVYQITETGRTVFLDWLNSPVRSMRTFRVEFIARLHFFTMLNLPGAGLLIQQEIEFFRQLQDEWDVEAPRTANDLTSDMVIDFRKHQAQMITDWLIAWQEHFIKTAPRS